MQRLRRLQVLVPALPFALVACGSVVEQETVDRQQLEATFGGQTEADELPAFGDEGIALADDEAVEDPPREPIADAHHIRIAVMWGYLRPRPDAETEVDWTGSITVANGAVRVLRTLRFEDQDAVVRPRTDRAVIEFDSQTRPHADGLLLDVVTAPTLNPDRQPITLTFASAPYTGTLTLSRDMRLSRVVPVDEDGHVIAYHIVRPDRDGCAEGFLRGRWEALAEAEGGKLGVVQGRFIAADGRVRGHVRGIYGVRENGNKVWFAKVVGAEGKFLGLIAGRYDEGKLAGLLLGRDKEVRGMVRGHYRDGEGDEAGGFVARFSEKCGEDPREGEPAEGDEPEVELEDIE